VTLIAHLVPSLGFCALLRWPFALTIGGALWAVTAWRLVTLHPEGRRPLWVTRLLDEPLCCQWAASLLSLPLLLPCTLALWEVTRLRVVPGLEFGFASSALTAYASGLVLAVWGTWGRRRWFVVRRLEVPIRGLSGEFDGYRVVQLSDLHIGNFDRKAGAARWVARVNGLKPNLVVVTGDLVTSGTEFYPDVAEVLADLRAVDGVICILGNHDQWDEGRCRSLLQARGLTVLTNQWCQITKAGAALIVAGLGDPFTGKADLDVTLRGRPEHAPTLLLSHYPDWFEPAAEKGVDLVLSGHTHGGQLGVPFFADRLNLAALMGQRGRGLFRQGQSAMYVNAGLGTTGPPLRLGIPPEIALIALRSPLAGSESVA
jgi:predicted MPP superfamily phosphohydrolase